MRTQVGIVGAGPAGLLLSHLLHLQGIESVVLEARSRDYVENRIRAGVLEFGTEQLLNEFRRRRTHAARGDAASGRGHAVWSARIIGSISPNSIGKHVMVYSQHKVVQDLIAARLAAGGEIVFEAADVSVHDFQTERAAYSLSPRWCGA